MAIGAAAHSVLGCTVLRALSCPIRRGEASLCSTSCKIGVGAKHWRAGTVNLFRLGHVAGEVTRLNRVFVQRGSPVAVNKNDKISSLDNADLLERRAKELQIIERSLPDFDELDRDELAEFLDLELESSYDFQNYKHYEIVYLIHEKNADEVEAVMKKVKDFIAENKGIIHRLNDWGMRNLAYKIKKASRANYILMNIEITAQVINNLDALLQKDERVIRHMILSRKAAITEECKPPEEYHPSRIGEELQADEDEDDLEDEELMQTELVVKRE